jgi:NhaP-type Na+/H+ or K+/H+ antiporter
MPWRCPGTVRPARLFTAFVSSVDRIEVKHIYAQSIMFGIPVVILITVSLAAVVKSFTDWTWALSLLFGSCLSATDPVSVLPVMRTTGASHAITILVLGESLLSEGAATVLFHIFENKIEGETYNFAEIFKLVLEEFVLSVIVGILGGLIAVYLMSFANQHLRSQDSILQVAISIVCAYFIFFCAQSLLHLSGVLATCTAAVYVASFAQGVILNHHTFHNIWALLEWAAQTLIFLFAGLVLKDKTRTMIHWGHIPQALAIYLVMVSLRAAFILLTYKFAGSVSGHKLSFKEACFFGFTGLKGAVGMILSLVSYGLADLGYLTEDEAGDFIVLASLVIGLSMFLGGTLTRYFIKGVGLRPQDTPESVIVKRYLRSRVRADVLREYEAVKDEFAGVDVSSLMEYSGLLQTEVDDTLHLELDTQVLRQTLTSLYDPATQQLNTQLLYHLRVWYLNSVKACYFHHISIGKLPRHSYSAQLLLQSINATLDNDDPKILGDFEVVLDGLSLNPYLRYVLEVVVVPVTTCCRESWNPIALLEAQQMKRAAYTWSSFCSAHHHAATVISAFLQDDPCPPHSGHHDSIRSERHCTQHIPEVLLLLRESKESVDPPTPPPPPSCLTLSQIARATNLLNVMEPRELTSIYENQAAKMLLNKEASLISQLSHEGMMTPHDSETELKRINADLNSIEKLRKAHSKYVRRLVSLTSLL